MGEPTPLSLVYSETDDDPSGQKLVESIANGWLGEYVYYAGELTDSPPIFHLAVGLSMLATACGSRVIFRGGGGRWYWPNLYILFVAPSGLMRKSTSIEIGLNLLRKADPEVIIPNETSREEFLRILSIKPEGLIRESEFASALARYHRDYMGGFKELITDLYDPYVEYRRQIKGREGTGEKLIIKKPALNYLAASTVEWLIDSLTENDLRSGFLARFLVFPATSKGKWVSFLSEAEEDVESRLVDLLMGLRRLHEVRVSYREVLKPFNVWVREMESVGDVAQPEIVGFYARLALHCAKLAALLEISSSGLRDHYTISEENFDRAAKLMEWLRDRYAELLEQKLVFSREERVMQKILDLIRKDGKLEWGRALRGAHLKAGDFDRYVSTLVQRGEVKVITESTRGRPARTLCLPGKNGRYQGKITDLATEANVNKVNERE